MSTTIAQLIAWAREHEPDADAEDCDFVYEIAEGVRKEVAAEIGPLWHAAYKLAAHRQHAGCATSKSVCAECLTLITKIDEAP